MHESGGSCLKYLKGCGTEKMGGDTKILKRGSKFGQGVGALKRGGVLEPPYELYMVMIPCVYPSLSWEIVGRKQFIKNLNYNFILLFHKNQI